jgi:broad specificity phosphatase PhoE
LLRHGETDWNLLGKIQGGGYDIPLNDNGRLQAEKAAAELDGIPLGIVASSSLSRARETADILRDRHPNDDITRVVDEGFNEMRFGEFEGYSSSADGADPDYLTYFKAMSRKVKDDPTCPFPGGGESTADVERRSIAALQRILQEADPSVQHIAIVSHGRTNKVIIAATALGDVQRFKEVRQSNTAINVIDVDTRTGVFQERIINHIEHVKDHVILRIYPHHK